MLRPPKNLAIAPAAGVLPLQSLASSASRVCVRPVTRGASALWPPVAGVSVSVAAVSSLALPVSLPGSVWALVEAVCPPSAAEWYEVSGVW